MIMISEHETGQKESVQQTLEFPRLATPPHWKGDYEMIAIVEFLCEAPERRLPFGALGIAMAQDGIEVEIADRKPLN